MDLGSACFQRETRPNTLWLQRVILGHAGQIILTTGPRAQAREPGGRVGPKFTSLQA